MLDIHTESYANGYTVPCLGSDGDVTRGVSGIKGLDGCRASERA